MDQSQPPPKLFERLDNAENLLFTLMSDVEKVLRLFSKNISCVLQQIEQIDVEPEDKEIEEISLKAFKKLHELGQKLKEITRDLPIDIPRQIKNDNSESFQSENLELVLENYIREINEVIGKEKIKFPNTFNYNNNGNNILDA